MREDDSKPITITYEWAVNRVFIPFVLPLTVAVFGLWLTKINTDVAQLRAELQQVQITGAASVENRRNLEARLERIDSKIDELNRLITNSR